MKSRVDGQTVRHLDQHEDVPGTGRYPMSCGDDGDEDGGEEQAGVEGGAQYFHNFVLGQMPKNCQNPHNFNDFRLFFQFRSWWSAPF